MFVVQLQLLLLCVVTVDMWYVASFSRFYKIFKRKVQIVAEEDIVLKKKMVIVKATLFLR